MQFWSSIQVRKSFVIEDEATTIKFPHSILIYSSSRKDLHLEMLNLIHKMN
jgi:hypothetical protein